MKMNNVINDKPYKDEQAELIRLNRVLGALSKSRAAMVRASDENLFLSEICRIIVEDCGFAMVWIGYAQNDKDRIVKPIAFAGSEDGYLQNSLITWSDSAHGRGPTGTSIRTGMPVICRNILTDPDYEPWREEALKRGYASSLALPLINNHCALGALVIFSKESNAFEEEEINFLSELASDLSSGIQTLRLKSAEEFLQNEHTLPYYFENFPLGVLETDADFKVIKWSGEAERIFGWKNEDVMGKTIYPQIFVHHVNIPFGSSIVQGLTSKRHNTMFSTNLNFTQAGKIVTCTWYSSILFNEKGEIMSILSLIDDITDKMRVEEAVKESEEKYRLLFTKMMDGFVLLKLLPDEHDKPYDSVIVHFNPAAELITGLKSKRVVEKRFRQVFPELEHEWMETYRFVAITGKSIEFEKYSPSLNKYLKVSAFCPEKGYCAIIFEDISEQIKHEAERKKAEETLRKNAMELKDLNARKDNFFRIIAHDLKNPFNVLLGVSDLLYNNMEEYNNEKIKSFIFMLNETARKGYALLENLLEWSRTQTGSIYFQPQSLNLKSIIEGNMEYLSIYANNKRVVLKSEVEKDIEVIADKDMLNAIMRNLLQNAIKYTKENGEVAIKVSSVEDEITVAVKDTGIGITPENLEKLFRIDVQLSLPGTSNEKGTGLGLLLCKEFVEKHNGKIWAESAEGCGTEFKFTIPAKFGINQSQEKKQLFC